MDGWAWTNSRESSIYGGNVRERWMGIAQYDEKLAGLTSLGRPGSS